MSSSRALSLPLATLVLLPCSSLSLEGRAPPTETRPADGPFREIGWDAALAAARSEGRPLLVALFAGKCEPCDRYDSTVFADERVASWLTAEVVAIRRVDDEELARRFETRRAATLVLASSDGEELDRIEGYLEPPRFLEEVRAILDGRSALGQARRAVAEAPDDPHAHVELARVLEERGRYRATLEQYLWVLDRTAGAPDWPAESRVGLFRSIYVLRPRLPEAVAALTERRAAAAAVVLGPHAADADVDALVRSAGDLVAINLLLSQARNTLETWETLRKREDAPAAVLKVLFGETTQQVLLGDERYSELLEALGDPLAVLNEELTQVQLVEQAVERQTLKRSELVRCRARALASAGRYYHAFLGAGREDEALLLVEMLLAYDPSVDAYLALLTVADRLERKDVVRSLGDRGLAAFPQGAERERLTRFLRVHLPKDG